MENQQDFPAEIKSLIEMMDRYESEPALTMLKEMIAEIERAVSAIERDRPPAVGNLDASLTAPDRALRLLSARLHAAEAEIQHTHFMQAKDRLQAALHAHLSGEEVTESSTA